MLHAIMIGLIIYMVLGVVLLLSGILTQGALFQWLYDLPFPVWLIWLIVIPFRPFIWIAEIIDDHYYKFWNPRTWFFSAPSWGGSGSSTGDISYVTCPKCGGKLGDRWELRKRAGADIFNAFANVRVNTQCPHCGSDISLSI